MTNQSFECGPFLSEEEVYLNQAQGSVPILVVVVSLKACLEKVSKPVDNYVVQLTMDAGPLQSSSATLWRISKQWRMQTFFISLPDRWCKLI